MDVLLTLIQAGPAALLIWGGINKWYVFGWLYEQRVKENEELRGLLSRALKIAEGSNAPVKASSHDS